MTHFLGTFAKLQKASIGFTTHVCLPVCSPSALNSVAPTGQIFMKFDILVFFENLSRKVKFYYNMIRITGT
jgi:hypothetical protein